MSSVGGPPIHMITLAVKNSERHRTAKEDSNDKEAQNCMEKLHRRTTHPTTKADCHYAQSLREREGQEGWDGAE